jgi:hypothetical protein
MYTGHPPLERKAKLDETDARPEHSSTPIPSLFNFQKISVSEYEFLTLVSGICAQQIMSSTCCYISKFNHKINIARQVSISRLFMLCW